MLKRGILCLSVMLLACSGGGDDPIPPTPEPEVIMPANLNLTITLVGADADNQYGDGSGKIQCVASAINAVNYKFKFNNTNEQESINGSVDFEFTEPGINSYVVTVFAFSSTGHSISTFQNVEVLVDDGNPTVLWSDEFDVDGAVSSANWFAETVPPNNGSWWNNETQHYTDRTDNAYVSNGTLKIVAKKETYTFQGSTKHFTSARLNTQNKFNFTYGRVDVRAKLPAENGTWPAIWLLGANINTVGWPACGEIDIMEQTGWDKNKVLATCHWYDNTTQSNASYGLETGLLNASSEFHIYSMEWTPTFIKMFVDDVPYYQIDLNDNLPFNKDFFIILNIAMEGDLGGTADPNFSEAVMEIDYVRVYQ